ncbi:MAG: hypothetical protein ATN36_07845 [Epulopiscium sp. Nele67-Bin005]|nr:MAG: hypothetical protein ATN36_07845 [Epulopiscium sp. Nele67-Bin005]
MGMPQIPEGTNRPCFDELIIDLLESIALEEMAMAHLMNAEGEKMQEVVNRYRNKEACFCHLAEAYSDTQQMINSLIMQEWLLINKLIRVQKFNDSRPCSERETCKKECKSPCHNHCKNHCKKDLCTQKTCGEEEAKKSAEQILEVEKLVNQKMLDIEKLVNEKLENNLGEVPSCPKEDFCYHYPHDYSRNNYYCEPKYYNSWNYFGTCPPNYRAKYF